MRRSILSILLAHEQLPETLLLFGHRLPSLMRSLGRGVVEFKHGLNAPPDDDDAGDDKGQDAK